MPNHPAQSLDDVYWTDGDQDVPVFQHPQEFDALLAIYEQLAPKTVLEIGTYYGGTLKQWIARAPKGAHIVSIDLPARDGPHRPDLFHHWAEQAKVDLTLLIGASQDPAIIAKAAKIGPFDFVLIDADHTYDAVRQDWETYNAMVRPGGIVAFHDILEHPLHPEIQTKRLWDELVARPDLETQEIVEDRTARWGGIGVITIPEQKDTDADTIAHLDRADTPAKPAKAGRTPEPRA